MKTLGFIGCGNMASAMLKGILKKGEYTKENILAYDVLEEARDTAKKELGIQIASSNTEVVKKADVLFLAVKPFYFGAVADEIRASIRAEQIIISIAAGVTLENIKELLFGDYKVIRVMPNTPALVGCGAAALCKNNMVSEEEMKMAVNIFESFGIAKVVNEDLMDTVVGISGSSPAYVFMFIEAMADAAVLDGMPRKMAYELAAQSVMGSAKMVLDTGKHPGELKDMVCSPKGTTIEAVRVLEQRGLRSAVMEAQIACVDKSRNL